MTQKKLTMSFPVEDEINGVPVGHPRFMLHCRASADKYEVEWKVSCSLPDDDRNVDTFEITLNTCVNDEDIHPDLQNLNKAISTAKDTVLRAINENIAFAQLEAPDLGLQLISKDQLSTNSVIKQWRDGLLSSLQGIDKTLPHPIKGGEVSIWALLSKLIELHSERHRAISSGRRNDRIISIALDRYLLKHGVNLTENDAMALKQLKAEDGATVLFQLEPLEKAKELLQETNATALSTERIFAGVDVIMDALQPRNQGKAVIRNESYACFPPTAELVPTGDVQQYLDANVEKGIIGAKYDEHWIFWIVERNMLIGLLDSWQRYQQNDIPRLVLGALKAPPPSEET
ncbi:MAG: hypothetical protein KIH65_002915 [Candidatus Uhrbacteria bacterium]|nr:hypothetical protein [Candidatus Uhrbacteria bacterium]